MENAEFKELFGRIALLNGYEYKYGGWFKESNDCIVVLDLQKSNFGNYYDLNLKTYIQGVFGMHYSKSKDLVKKDTGDIFTRQPKEYNDILNLELPLDPDVRSQKLNELFDKFIVPQTNTMLSREKIIALARSGVFILPAVRKELGL